MKLLQLEVLLGGSNSLWQRRNQLPMVVLVLLAITALNAVLVFALAGFHAYLPDDPTSYRLFEDLGWSTPSE